MDVNQTLFDSIEIKNGGRMHRTEFNVCLELPPRVVSDGLWASPENGALPSKSALTIFNFQVIVIFVITQFIHFFLKRLGFPLCASQMMAGFILGPSIHIEAIDHYKRMLFPYGSQDTLALISTFGYTLFLFLNCVQMDYTMVTRTGKKVWALSFAPLITPLLIGFIVLLFFPDRLRVLAGEHFDSFQVVLITHNNTSFAVIASFLNDLKILNSELGRLALSSALVSDLLSYTVSGMGTAIVSGIHHNGKSLPNLVSFFAFFIIVPMLARPAMLWVVKQTPEGRPVKKIYTYSIIFMALLLGLITTTFGQPFFTGAIILGLAVPEGIPLGSALVDQLDLFATHFFLPIFVTSSCMKVDLSLGYNPNLLMAVTSLLFLVYSLKMLICIIISWYCKMPVSDGFILALILCCKGFVEICSFTLFMDYLYITAEIGGIMVMSVLVIATVVRICVNSMYDPLRKYAGYNKRNIMSLSSNSELRIVSCIHKPSHISAIRNILDIFCPTTNHPIIVDVLHLMELVGRVSPIFISHRLQERIGSGHHNFSGDIIVTFDVYEHDNLGAASVNTYSAISPTSIMHEDICHLALDKLASIILLPFHIRYADDGSKEWEGNYLRTVNCKVLERAPCSVAILVTRGRVSSTNSSNYSSGRNRIAMIFLGGGDDREALCLAKRVIGETGFSLVVYHLVGTNQNERTTWDLVLDQEELKGVRETHSGVQNVAYEEIHVDDASQTTEFLSDIGMEFDFIVVGRRHGVKTPQTDALGNWSEFPELGAIGDLLSSPDFETNASILVVQQQQMCK